MLRGDLNDPESLRTGAAGSDGVIHLAFGDFNNFPKSIAAEALAVETFAAALQGSGKPLVIASGTPVVPGRVSTEQDPFLTDGPLGGRGRNAQTVLDLAERGARPAVVRLPRSVHAQGERCGFASVLIDAARRTGVSGYVGDGTQRWPAVHRLDAARLFRLVLEDAAPGTVVPAENFGFLGNVFVMDQPTSSALTRETFGWQPTHPSLLEDLEAGNYPA